MMLIPKGALVNAITVTVGSSIGLLLHESIPHDYQTSLLTTVGLAVLIMGAQMTIHNTDAKGWTILIMGLLIGLLIGNGLDVRAHFLQLADALKHIGISQDPRFSEGLLAAFVIFCVGAMTLMGSLEEGLTGNRSLIYAKATLDGFTSVALAASYGIGVLFAALPLLLFQSTITHSASLLRRFLDEATLPWISATGGLLIAGIGLEMLRAVELPIENLLPALFTVPLLARLSRSIIQ